MLQIEGNRNHFHREVGFISRSSGVLFVQYAGKGKIAHKQRGFTERNKICCCIKSFELRINPNAECFDKGFLARPDTVKILFRADFFSFPRMKPSLCETEVTDSAFLKLHIQTAFPSGEQTAPERFAVRYGKMQIGMGGEIRFFSALPMNGKRRCRQSGML